ncbi:MAG: toprim domain-containing protein [Clostridium sp.]|uniref:toprim domain-containing protein n=1 Tax=Clostridium sp. TaxID=1506 RepID=UPI0039E7B83C
MEIRDIELEVDVLEELEQFDWVNEQIRGNKFQACSPFRSDNHPSFAVNLGSGLWIDSGSTDDYYYKGNFTKLLALLRNEDYETIENYLIEKYTLFLSDTSALELHLNLYGEQDKPKIIERSEISNLYTSNSNYLTNRGITLEVQKLFGTGYLEDSKAIALLWTNKKGEVVNVKYRTVAGKTFWYEKEGQPIRQHLFGIYQCILQKAKRIYLCEAEIDALTFWSAGLPAVAVGGSNLSEEQVRILLSSGIEELVIATDNDPVGARFREHIKDTLAGFLVLSDFPVYQGIKDINQLGIDRILVANNDVKPSKISFL